MIIINKKTFSFDKQNNDFRDGYEQRLVRRKKQRTRQYL
jgi:hypothetical protein